MPCEWLSGPNGEVIHVNRGRMGGKFQCKFCHCNAKKEDAKLCDFPVGNGKTCDAQMCSSCAMTLGSQQTDIGHGMKKLNDTIDVCPIHRTAVFQNGKWEIDG